MSALKTVGLRGVGLMQGGGLWWIWHCFETRNAMLDHPMVLAAIFWAILAIPGVLYLTEASGLEARRRRVLVAGLGFFYTALGGYAGWVNQPASPQGYDVSPFDIITTPDAFFAAAILGFVFIALVLGRESGRWSYVRLHAMAWRNAVLCGGVTAVTGLFWVVLYAGALLMESLGIDAVMTFIGKPLFVFPVTGIVVGTLFDVGHRRWGTLLESPRAPVLALQAWLLPLLMLFGVMWAIVLPFQGLEVLLDTGSAAWILLWFAALSIYFMNTAYRNGEGALIFPPGVALTLRYAWCVMPLVVAIAAVALYQRIAQYGLTEDRIWGAFVLILALGYSLGYVRSIMHPVQSPLSSPLQWMPTVESTNIIMATVMVVGMALLASPVADPRRLAIHDQVSRVLSGKVDPSEVDYVYFARFSGQWGLRALNELASMQGDARAADLASRARQTLLELNTPSDASTTATDTASVSIERIIRPDGETTPLPDDLVAFLSDRDGRWNSLDCLDPSSRCLVSLQDINRDGTLEALLVVETPGSGADTGITAGLFSRTGTRWERIYRYHTDEPLDAWQGALAAGRITWLLPRWPDLAIDGKRLPIAEGAYP